MVKRTGPDEATVALVLGRDQYRCVKCGHQISGDRGIGWSLQHRRPRGLGGSSSPAINRPSNLLTVHGSGTTSCHGQIEANRTASLSYGWLVSQHSINGPAETPVLITTSPGDGMSPPQIEWRLLDDVGGWTRYEHEEARDEAA